MFCSSSPLRVSRKQERVEMTKISFQTQARKLHIKKSKREVVVVGGRTSAYRPSMLAVLQDHFPPSSLLFAMTAIT